MSINIKCVPLAIVVLLFQWLRKKRFVDWCCLSNSQICSPVWHAAWAVEPMLAKTSGAFCMCAHSRLSSFNRKSSFRIYMIRLGEAASASFQTTTNQHTHILTGCGAHSWECVCVRLIRCEYIKINALHPWNVHVCVICKLDTHSLCARTWYTYICICEHPTHR
jgi:hypothetical protein